MDFLSKRPWQISRGRHVLIYFYLFLNSNIDTAGIGGYLKQNAAEESKRKGLKEPIQDAKSFSNFMLRKKYQTIPVLISTEEIDQKVAFLEPRWSKSQTVAGTQKFHHYEVDPEDINYLNVKYFSSSNVTKRVKLTKKRK